MPNYIHICLFFYFPYAAFSILICHIWNEMSLQIRFYFRTNSMKVINYFTASPPPIFGEFVFCFLFFFCFVLFSLLSLFFIFVVVVVVVFYFFQNGEQISFFRSFTWICARFSVLRHFLPVWTSFSIPWWSPSGATRASWSKCYRDYKN